MTLGGCHRARCAELDGAFADDTRFVAAVRAGDVPMCTDGEGWTLLHRAAQAGRVVAMGALLDRGADLRQPGLHGRTALYEAAKYGHVAAVNLLLDRGADPNVRENSTGFTPLHVAAERHHLAVIRVLLARGAEVNALNQLHQTPLWQASWQPEQGDDAVARLLLAAGAATEVHDVVGATPLMKAARHHLRPFVLALLDAGANPNATDDEGYTAMDWATAGGHGDVVTLLRARGGRRGIR
ncbi:MAG: ankyrin repeat domain-containing protein [Polyangiales bacterium]